MTESALSWHRHRGWLLVLAGLLVSAISSGTDATHAGVRCELGLDLWDTDPALTWIEDGRIWVRAGSRQACLTATAATTISWSPDGLRVLLDDVLVEGEERWVLPDDSRPVTWEQPFGERFLAVNSRGEVQTLGPVGSGLPAIAAGAGLSGRTSLVSPHPDAKHLAVLDHDGAISLVASATGEQARLLTLTAGERVLQMEFSPDGSRLWILVDTGQGSEARFVDLTPVSDFLDIPLPSSLVASSSEPEIPGPDLRFLTADLRPNSLNLRVGLGAVGRGATSFVLHPAHPDWLVLSEGSCKGATSSLFMGGRLMVEGLPGAGVGFFFGQGHPVLATTTAGLGCGQGGLWITSGPSGEALGTPVLIADGVSSADIRDQAGDPWNPQSDPPFA